MSITFERQADGTYTQVDDPPKIADMVVVVRCRDCKYASYDNRWCYRLLNAKEPPITPDGFCAWGERK